jgi:filamentous hemagglutinin family protein
MAESWNKSFWRLSLACFLTIAEIIVSSLSHSVYAQNITPDNTLGTESSSLLPLGDNVNDFIVGGKVEGSNLFHSFQEFNVGEGRGAFFLTDTSNIQNIIARVTGTNVSRILGTLGAYQLNNNSIEFSNANLFLINPNGIIVGPNAYITIGGSFVGSTASGIQFADGTVFSAADKQTEPLLTVTTPIGLQFGSNPGSILVDNSLIEVSPGKTLALVGGNVSINDVNNFIGQRSLFAEGGQVAIGGISESGSVGLNLESNNQPLTFPDGAALADVSFTQGAVIDVNGNGGGSIQLQGRNITLTGGPLLSADTTGSQSGRGISIQSQQLTLRDGTQIRASTRSNGGGGSVTVNVSDTVQVSGTDADGNPSALLAETFAQGAAGNLTITTQRLIVEDGANIAAAARQGSQGSGGILRINASDFVRLSGTSLIRRNLPSGLFAQTQGSGNAGALTINTRQLIAQNGAQVRAGTLVGGSGNGGTLTVTATDSIQLSGNGTNTQTPSGLFASSLGTGNAGSLNIFTRQLTVRDNATVTVGSLDSGNAGNLNIEARFVRLDNQGTITAESSSGQGGNISLKDLDLLLLQNNSQITTTADTSRVSADIAGANIDIDAQFIVAGPGGNSNITTNAFRGRGGNINIAALGIFGLFGVNAPYPISVNSLPTNTVNKASLVDSGCSSFDNKTGSRFTVTGRGGLPNSPDDIFNGEALWSDTRLAVARRPQNDSVIITAKPQKNTQTVPMQAIPATGWVFNDQGEVKLVNQVASSDASTVASHKPACNIN